MPAIFEQRILATRGISEVSDEQMEPNHLRRVNLRANLSANLSDKLDVQVSSGFVTSSLRLPQIDNNAFGIGSNGFGGPGFKNFLVDPGHCRPGSRPATTSAGGPPPRMRSSRSSTTRT